MANWTVPSTKGYVPRGRGMRAAMGGLREGVGAFTSQMLAIRQYEAEQEEKRQKAEQERIQAALKAAFEQKKFAFDQKKFAWDKQQDIDRAERDKRRIDITDYAAKSLAGYRDWQKETQKQQDDLGARIDKEFVNLEGVQTDVGKRFVKMLYDARTSGDVGKVKQVYDNILRNQDLMRTYTTKVTTKGGEEQTIEQPANDANILLGVTQRTLPMLTQLYGQPQKGQYAYPLDQNEELKKQLIEIQAMDDDAAARAIQQLIQGGVDPTLLDRLIDEINQ